MFRQKKVKKIIIIIVCSLVLFIIYSFNKGRLYSEDYAVQIVEEEFAKYAKRKGLKINDFVGPNKVIMDVKWAYEWKCKADANRIIGINIDNSGKVEKYSANLD